MIQIVDKKGNVTKVHPVDAMEIVRAGSGKYLAKADVPKAIQLMGEKKTVSEQAAPEAAVEVPQAETPEPEAEPESVVANLGHGAIELEIPPEAPAAEPTGRKVSKRRMNGDA